MEVEGRVASEIPRDRPKQAGVCDVRGYKAAIALTDPADLFGDPAGQDGDVAVYG
jgi:hypothetical protein